MIDEAFTRWRAPLLRYCAQLLRNNHDAEEVVQDVFARLVERGSRYDLTQDAGVLLFRIARNRCIDVRRKRALPTTRREPLAIDSSGRDGDRNDLAEALAKLPFAEREVLLLTTVDGLGYRDVATILGCSLGTVAMRRYAAIENLRRRLAR